ncbi:hypothetical protein, partial [Entomohabitans teleogrylli]|uniref:hypothetical protein n=1 Tax=Entomohabitans teleogrylli TaxID=1384589 RepID=UPI00201139D7
RIRKTSGYAGGYLFISRQSHPQLPSPRLYTGKSPVSFSTPGNPSSHCFIFLRLTGATLSPSAQAYSSRVFLRQ